MNRVAALLLAGAATVGATGASFAAPPPPPPIYNWTGFYLGIHGGYGGGPKDWDLFGYVAEGGFAGGQIGFNQQVGTMVFGLEADFSWAHINGSVQAHEAAPFSVSTRDSSHTTKLDSMSTVAARFGFAADRWLVFAKAGYAWANEHHTVDSNFVVAIQAFPFPQVTSLAGSELRNAPMIGFGAEYASYGNWSAKAEYDIFDFPGRNVHMTGTASSLTTGVTAPFASNLYIAQRLHVAKVGLNYRLGPERPAEFVSPHPPRMYDWTGAYVGVQGAGGWQGMQWQRAASSFAPEHPYNRYDISGWLAGGLAGAKVQATSVLVAGVEFEAMVGRIDGSRSDTFGPLGGSLATRLDWLSMATAQLGFLATDRLLVYGKGGVALAHATHGQATPLLALGGGGSQSQASANEGDALHTGAVGGFGAEYAFLGNWSAKFEYNYIHFSPQQVFMPGTAIGVSPGQGTLTTNTVITMGIGSTDMHLVKFGINYRFGPNLLAGVR